jgi:DNA polymerase-1
MKQETKRKTLVLLDAHAIIHRAYHALPEFTSSKGEPTGGLYGIATMLMKIIKELKPNYIIACYDLPAPTFRKEMYEGYKSGRPKADESLVHQIKRSRDIFTAFNIPIYEKAGFEADDIIGTIVSMLSGQRSTLKIIIASGDMDTLQLVSGDDVVVYTLKKGINDTILYNEKAVKERFGFGPKLMPDFKGLRGDPSDNIIGIAGIGEKTATTLITEFGTIEELYKKLKKKDGEKIFEKKGIKPRMWNLLKEGEDEALFSKTLGQIRHDAPIDFSLPKREWQESFEESTAEKLFRELEFKSIIPRLKGLSHEKTGDDTSLIGNVSGKEKINEEEFKKTALALWLADSHFTNPMLEDMLSFSDTDSFSTARDFIFKELEKRELKKVYSDIELPLMPVIEAAEKIGVLVDIFYLKKLSSEYHKKLSGFEKKIWKHAGREFNINSPKQMAEVLFQDLGLDVKGLKKTEGGARSTRVSELLKLRGEHPIIEVIMEHREYQKLLSTYIDAIPPLVDSDGRLHTDFIQTGTTTGRIASANPNLQNIPIKNESGRAIRSAFIAQKGCTLVAFDYSQIELRIAAFLSDDDKLLKIFRHGEDVHAGVAAEVFHVPIIEVTKEMRRQAKVINFGILYGMGINALKENLGTTREEARVFYENYFATFSGLAAYTEKIKQSAIKKGYTETYFGRRRYFPELKSKIPYIYSSALRMVTNAPLQGTQADIIKIAMVQIDEWIAKKNLRGDAQLLLQIHDELIYEIKNEHVDDVTLEVRRIMEHVVSVSVPIVVNVVSGKTWGEME